MALARTLMIQGTASHVGKSVMTAALCRIFRNMGVRVAPFKAQNMSNNSYVTLDGLEVARAQAVQAEACGLEPDVRMSPVLLKPESDRGSQVVLMGKPALDLGGFRSHYKRRAEPVILEALESLRRDYDLVLIEGAGSPAEVNLRARDIVNMRIAQAAQAPVILVGNIDWGGVFAQFVGTLELLTSAERRRVKAFLVNQFRGDLNLLKPGLQWLERKTRRKVLGVIPYWKDLALSEEDSLGRDSLARVRSASSAKELHVDVVLLPRMANFTDFERLSRQPGVRLNYLRKPDRHRIPDLLILPGTKSTIADLEYLQQSGMAGYIQRCARAGTWILGICGGYQMLGEKIRDPRKVESSRRMVQGLGLLPVETVFSSSKETNRVQLRHAASGINLQGYEVHMGRTRMLRKEKPLFKILSRNGKACSEFEGVDLQQGASRILGTYVHGLFDQPEFLQFFLGQLRTQAALPAVSTAAGKPCFHPDKEYDLLARRVTRAVDMDFLRRLADV